MTDDDLVWRQGLRTPGHDYRVFKTSFVDATHPQTGATKRFSVIEAVDWVNVIALTPDDQVVLIRQHRAGANRVCLEIPGGMVDEGEAPNTAAARELEEETGYTAPTWKLLGVTAPNPAIQNNRLWSYLALDAAPDGNRHFDSSEVIALETRALADVQRALRTGEIDHALVVAAFGHLALQCAALCRP